MIPPGTSAEIIERIDGLIVSGGPDISPEIYGQENGNFPFLYAMEMSLRMWVGDSKKPQNTLIKMAPYLITTVPRKLK